MSAPAATPPLNNDCSSILDLTRTKHGSKKPEGASSHAAVYVQHGNDTYRLKFNHHGPVATFHEVLAARINRTLFPKLAPEVRFGANVSAFAAQVRDTEDKKYTGVGIASRMVEGFKDWGDFLISDADGRCAALAHVPEASVETYKDLLKHYRDNRVLRKASKAQLALDNENVRNLLSKPKDDYTQHPETLVAYLQPLRTLDAEALALQDAMLELLPDSFRNALIRALYEAEAVGNWDFSNHERANVGFIVKGKELHGATAIDFGVCGPTGFSGKSKKSSVLSIQRPARVDDPYLRQPPLRYGHEHHQAPYIHGAMIDRQTAIDFSKVSVTAGLIGALPRSPVYAAMMKDVIRDEREYGIKPKAMVDVAETLSSSMDKVASIIETVWAECAASPYSEIKTMLNEVNVAGYTREEVIRMYHARFSSIVERSKNEIGKRQSRRRRSFSLP